VLPIVYARPWLTEIEEKPVPTDARHRTLGPPAGHAVVTFSAEMPLRFGPRHWGQSAAGKCAARNVAVTIQQSFTGLFYHERRGITRLNYWNFLRYPARFAVKLPG
jgi:hypothetical protein